MRLYAFEFVVSYKFGAADAPRNVLFATQVGPRFAPSQ